MLTLSALLLLAASGHAIDAVSQRRLMHAQLGKEVLPPLDGPAIDIPAKFAAFAIPGEDKSNGTLSDKDIASNATTKPKPPKGKFGPYCFKQKVSHFDDSEKGTFCQRYWVDSQYYKEGGPVFILDGGETSGANRIPFMETGILQILSNATNGLSIILEHRYYGESHVTADLSTDNLRWLNNKESLEDSAEFIRSFPVPDDVKRKLKDKKIFDPSKTPYIYYGGSYAGARAAFMRTEYPDLVYGAIGSSGVTHAQVYYPEYFDPIITYGEPGCIKAMEESIAAVDELLDKGSETNAAVKQLFGLEALTDLDFAGVLQYPTGGWQGQNWDPAVGSDEWDKWCRALTTARAANDSTPPSVAGMSVPASLFNYADYIKTSVIRPACPSGDIVSCFGESTPEEYQNTSLAQTWRLWQFQVCTQWGYYQVAPKSPKRTIVSRKITLESQAKVCKLAYPPGEKFQVPVWPDVHETNSRGSYYIAADRLAFIDGEIDPWRPVTPNADVAPKRNSTTLRPIWIIPRGVHHYDENGLADHSQEPEEIRAVHKFEIEFVQAWLKDFGKGNGGGGGHGHGHGQGQGHGHGDGHGDGHGHADGHGHGHGNGHGHGHHGHDDDQDDNQDGNDQGENEDGDGGGDDQQ